MTTTATTSTICGVCGRRVRVSSGRLVRHRDDGHHVCDNAGCDIEANTSGVPK